MTDGQRNVHYVKTESDQFSRLSKFKICDFYVTLLDALYNLDFTAAGYNQRIISLLTTKATKGGGKNVL